MSVMIQLPVIMFFNFILCGVSVGYYSVSVWFKRDWSLWMKIYSQIISGLTILQDP